MVKHQLTTKRLQNDSGEPSGIYLFCDGVMLFAPVTRETVLQFTKKSLLHGPNAMVRSVEHMLKNAAAPTTVPHSQGEGTHGAGSDNDQQPQQ